MSFSIDSKLLNSILENRGYKYIKQISKGTFGTIHIVFSKQYQEEFVLKIIEQKSIENKENCFEISSLLRLCHPNIVAMYDHWIEKSYFFIVLEYCSGGSIHDRILEKGPLSNTSLITYTRQILQAVDFCHSRGVAHRDIKPQNILIDKHGRPKLADFGLSQLIDDNSLSKHFHGSPLSLAPEILRKTPYNPFKADIWSLGVTFYIMATGNPPWKASNKIDYHQKILEGYEISFKGINEDYSIFLQSLIKFEPNLRIEISKLLKFKLFKDQIIARKSCNFNSLTPPPLKSSQIIKKQLSVKSILTFV